MDWSPAARTGSGSFADALAATTILSVVWLGLAPHPMINAGVSKASTDSAATRSRDPPVSRRRLCGISTSLRRGTGDRGRMASVPLMSAGRDGPGDGTELHWFADSDPCSWPARGLVTAGASLGWKPLRGTCAAGERGQRPCCDGVGELARVGHAPPGLGNALLALAD